MRKGGSPEYHAAGDRPLQRQKPPKTIEKRSNSSIAESAYTKRRFQGK
jgi:hypothetical protein